MSALDKDTVEMTVPCQPRFLSVVRLTVAGVGARAGLGVQEVEDVKVAVSEACTNAIEHAYPADIMPCGDIKVRLTAHDGELRLEVEDEGVGFDPKRLPKVEVDQPVSEEGGLGIYLMRQLMDEVRIESAPGSGTKIIMVKRSAR